MLRCLENLRLRMFQNALADNQARIPYRGLCERHLGIGYAFHVILLRSQTLTPTILKEWLGLTDLTRETRQLTPELEAVVRQPDKYREL